MQNTRMGMVRVVLVVFVFVVLLFVGAGMIRYSGFGGESGMLNGIGATLSAIVLAIIVSTDALFVVLIARTPNRRRQP